MKFAILSQRKSCYCAFCKVPRNVYRTKNLSFVTLLGLVGLSFVMTHVVWQSFDPRGLFILGLMIVAGEVFTQMRWRQSMICHNCGFDAVLYIRDPEKAGLKIKDFLEYRAQRPEYLLRPPVHLPKRKVRSSQSENISLRG